MNDVTILDTPLCATADIIEDLKQGKMVIIMDDEQRENEGDLIIAAEKITPEAINFMSKYARGLICLTITQERNDRLELWPQSPVNRSQFSTNFTVSIEAAQGVTTGISAADRARTVLAAVAPNAKPQDLVQPGHIFPIVAREGGVLTRSGHTEAGCDLTRLAGLEPAAVICEIMKDDGTMARRPDLEIFARAHQIKIGTIADLIAYRLSREQSIIPVSQCELPTAYGTFTLTAYQSLYSRDLHYALVKGPIPEDQPTFVRVHMRQALSDLFQAQLDERNYSLQQALEQLSREPHGIIVVLHEADEQQIIQRMHEFAHHTAPSKRPLDHDIRTFGIGAQILRAQNVHKMRLLSAPYKFSGISGFDLEVCEYIEHIEHKEP